MLVVTRSSRYMLLSLFVLAISACSFTSEKEDGYKGVYSSKAPKEYTLEMPPDLVAPDSSSALTIPGFSGGDSASDNTVLPRSSSGVRFVREGDVFWLEIKAKPEVLWVQLHNFFKELGFSFVTDNPENGLLETDWLENRINTPSGWFTSFISGLFSTGIKDKFRIRLERDDKENITRVFISHQGLSEESHSDWGSSDINISWKLRESDPDLEAEMLQRFLVYRGVAKAQAKKITSIKKQTDRAVFIEDKSTKTYRVEVNEIFPRTWRRISIALDRMGIVIEDRNRSKGVYYIKTTEGFTKVNDEDENWFASIFSSSSAGLQVASFQLKVDEIEAKTVISILNENGEPDTSKTGYFILKKLKEHLD